MIDMKDILIVVGMVLISAGAYLIDPVYAIISFGACLFSIGIKAM